MLITGLASCKLFPSSCFGARKAQIHFVVKVPKLALQVSCKHKGQPCDCRKSAKILSRHCVPQTATNDVELHWWRC